MSAKGGSSLSVVEIDDVRHKILIDHNKYRKKHRVPPLKLNDKLTAISQNWAETLLTTRVLKHRPASKFGENLWTGSGYKLEDLMVDGKADPVGSWYAEVKNYPEGNFESYGHFTQLIWKNSKYLGCGISYDSEIIFVVCNYDPPGNWKSKYKENIFTIEGEPWNGGESDEGGGGGGQNKTSKPDDNAEDTDEEVGGGGGGGGGRGPGPEFFGEHEQTTTSYWMYGLGFAVILIVVIFLAILVYYQKG